MTVPSLPAKNNTDWYPHYSALDAAIRALPETIRDTIAAALVQGANVTIVPNDGSDTITISAATTGASGIPASVVDAKGDLVVAAGPDSVARLAAGPAGQVLTTDPAATLGLKWAPGGLPGHVDVRDYGAVGDYVVATGAGTDNTAAIQAAIEAARTGVHGGKAVYLPPGRYKTTGPLTGYQNVEIAGPNRILQGQSTGTQGPPGAASIDFHGGPTDHCIQYLPTGGAQSRAAVTNLAIIDRRTSPTSGDAIHMENVVNQVVARNLLIVGFPTGCHVSITAPANATDCIEVSELWTIGARYGVYISGADNTVFVEDIKGGNGPATEAIVYVGGSTQSVTMIRGVKHEGVGTMPTVLLDGSLRGVQVDGVVSRSNGNGPLVRITSSGVGVTLRNLQRPNAGTLLDVTGASTPLQITGTRLPFWVGSDGTAFQVGPDGTTFIRALAPGSAGGGGAVSADPGPLEGMTHYSYGHSYTAANQPYATAGSGPGGPFPARLSDRQRMTHVARGTAGIRMVTAVRSAYSGSTVWIPNTRGLVTLCCTYNDVAAFGAAAADVRSYQHALRAFLAVTRAKAKILAASANFVFSPGWSKDTTSALNAAGRWQTTTVGAYAEVRVNGAAADLVLTLRSTGSGVYTITSDGTTVATVDLSATVGTDYTPTAVQLGGWGAGIHTLRITLTSGAFLGVDALLVPSEAPAPTLCVGEGAVVNATVAANLAGTWLPAMAAVAGEFPHARYVAANDQGWDSATMLNADGIHPNDRGASQLATAALAALADLGWTNGLNLMAPAPAYTAPAAPAVPSGGQAGGAGGGGVPTPPSGTLLAGDTFTRTDAAAAPGSTETGSLPWLQRTGAQFGISSTKLRQGGSGAGLEDCVVDTGSVDGTVQVSLVAIAGAGQGLFFRANSGHTTGYVFWKNGANYTLSRRTAFSSYVALGSSSGVTPADGDVLAVVLDGPSITCKVNGVAVISVTDSGATGTRHGVWSQTAGQEFDYFYASDATA